jgi:chromosomal replication initiation ATPase DnaA
MSMVESPVRETPAALRRRLLQPSNSHLSTELDIIAEPVARRIRAAQEQAARERAAEQASAAKAIHARATAEEEAARLAKQIHDRERRITELVDLIKQSEAELKTLCADSLRADCRNFSFAGKFPQLLDVVSKFYSVHTIHILSQQRAGRIIRPRHVVMYLATELTGLSLVQIGKRMGGRDHTTIINGRDRIAGLLADGDPQITAEIAAIKMRLGVE